MNRINISIDDVSPHPKSSTRVLNKCHEIIKIFPDVKFSLFVPISYWRTVKKPTITPRPLQIDLYPDFCEEIRKLSKENFEVCYHGFYHGVPGKSDNDEFENLDYSQAVKLFNAMFEVVRRANLESCFKKIFRPPAWRMSPEAIKAAKDVGIEILALSPKKYAKDIYCKEDEAFEKVVYYNVNPPFDELKMYSSTEIVYHACEWDKNYLCDNMKKNLVEFLKKEENKKFCFLEEM